MKSLRLLAAAVLALALGQGVLARSALASTCTADSHCYGEVVNNSGAIIGMSAEIDPSNTCFSAPAGAFVTAEEWLVDYTSTGGANGWVEAGYIDQHGVFINGMTSDGTSLFWGQLAPGGAFRGHQYLVGATGDTNRVVKIDKSSSSSYDVYLEGVGWTTATNNTMNPDVGQYGAESTVNAARDYSRYSNLAYHSGNTGAWATAVYNRTFNVSTPPMDFQQFGTYAYNYIGGIPC
jgi:hypothetical protein